MQGQRPIRLFKRGTSAEVKLTILAILAVVLLVVDARSTWLDPIRQGLATALYPLQRAAMAPGDLANYLSSWTDSAALVRSEKEALQRQRIELAQLSTHAAQLRAENEQLRRLLQVSDTVNQASVAVEVFYEPPNAFDRRLIFNKGAAAGIQPGMPVIDDGGVVGQIIRVTTRTAEAALITDDQVSVPVQILRNGVRLIAFGSPDGSKVEVRYLTNDADIEAGDTLVTSGIGGLFPAGLPVAKITSVERDSSTGFAVAHATPLSYPERYRHFLVLLVDEPEFMLGSDDDPTDQP